MKVTTGKHKDHPCVTVEGKIDRNDVIELDVLLSQEVARAKDVLILDLAGVEVAASGAISAIVDAASSMQGKGGVLKIYDPHPHVLELFKRLGLHQTLKFFKSSRHKNDAGDTKAHK